MARKIRVLLFATAREAVGAREITWEVPERGLPLAAVLGQLTVRYPGLRSVTAHARYLVNSEYVEGTAARVAPGDELAIHPPYSGG